MSLEQGIISLVVGVLIFLIVFYIGQASVLPSLFCGIIACVSNIFVSLKANQNKWK